MFKEKPVVLLQIRINLNVRVGSVFPVSQNTLNLQLGEGIILSALNDELGSC